MVVSVLLSVVLSGTFLLLHVRFQPFRYGMHNHLETYTYSALTLTYFIGLLMQNGAAESQYHAYGAILLVLTATVVLAAAAVGVIGARAGYHVLHKDDHAKDVARVGRVGRGGRIGGGRLVANERGLRLTSNRNSPSLGESLLGSMGGGDGND